MVGEHGQPLVQTAVGGGHRDPVVPGELSQPGLVDEPTATRRRHGKSDHIDAAAAARAVLSGRAAAKTTDGPVEAIRMFKMAKTSVVKSPSTAHQPTQSRSRGGGAGTA